MASFKKMIFQSGLALLTAATASAQRTPASPPSSATLYRMATGPSEIKVMTYNAHNLFDAEHDTGKLDFVYLPKSHPEKAAGCRSLANPMMMALAKEEGETPQVARCMQTDWTDAKVELKLRALEYAVRTAGEIPDLLALQEVENERVVGRLAHRLGYTEWLATDSPDRRGIDVALAYRTERLQLLGHEMLRIQDPQAPRQMTRDILRADFAVRGRNERLIVFVNHWPAQGAPTARRMNAAAFLKAQIQRARAQFGAGVAILALGDFNSTTDEMPNPFHNILHDPAWSESMLDAQQLARNESPAMAYLPPAAGTYFHAETNRWNKFDRIILSRSLADQKGMDFLPDSFRVLAAETLTSTQKITSPYSYHQGSIITRVPKPSNTEAEREQDQGFSDHFAVYIKLRI